MNILHINTTDIIGGAARAANRLHLGLRLLGVDSKMLVAQKRGYDKDVIQYKISNTLASRVVRKINWYRLNKYYAEGKKNSATIYDHFSGPKTIYNNKNLINQLPDFDIINLHWISHFIDYNTLFDILNEKTPIFWTLHDMNVFTGGCHYTNGCIKYKEKCGKCPQLGKIKENDLSKKIWSNKKKIFDQISSDQIHFVANSNWLKQEAQNSMVLRKFNISYIHFGLNHNIFCVRNKQAIRKSLNIPSESKVILFVSQSLSNRRKGFNQLIKAINELKSINNLILISIGNGKATEIKKIPVLNFGSIENDMILSLIFNAADIFVIPSLQEAFGQTALEAMACGTPVVGFDTGGIPDMVKPYETGLLAKVGDSYDLAEKIQWMLDNRVKREEMGKNCRTMVENEFRLDIQASRYLELYRNMLNKQQNA